MRNLPKQWKWLVVTLCVVVGLVASSAIAQVSQSESNNPVQPAPDCQLTGALAKLCPPTDTPTPTPPVIIDDKSKFFNAIATKLNPLPTPKTYEYLILQEYGGIFATTNPQIQLPPKVAFDTAKETKAFQDTLKLARVNAGRNCFLQAPAAASFNTILRTTPIPLKSGRGKSDCLRTFETTREFWNKYSNEKTLQKIRQGQLQPIMRKVAPPGSSQHLWGLAIDLGQLNPRQTQILNQNGWFQTVKGDQPHWTYLGMSMEELIQLGFKKQVIGRNTYWLTPLLTDK